MPNYVSLVWNRDHAALRQVARTLLERLRSGGEGWHTVLEEEGLAICCLDTRRPADDDVHMLSTGRGAVIGALFDRSSSQRAVLNERDDDAISADGGRTLVRRYWGKYVAFLRDPHSGDVSVIRDPTGGVPCQWTQIDGLDVYFQRVADIERMGARPGPINHRFLFGYLLYDSARTAQTGIEGVENVLAGECITHRSDRRDRALVWNPVALAAEEIIEDPAVAIRLMRETTSACVRAWASRFDRVSLRLSGGLDSAIVLACLAEMPARAGIICTNEYIEQGTSADERRYARLAAERAGCELIEREPSRAFNLDGVRDIARAVIPHSCFQTSQAARDEVQFMRGLGVQARLDGVGGDEVFCHGKGLPASVDYAWLHGPRLALARMALDDAEYRSVSYWKVLHAVWRYGLRRQRWNPCSAVPRDYRPLLRADVRASASPPMEFLPPHLRDVEGLPPGKLAHVYAMSAYTTRIHIAPVAGQDWLDVSPLCSQPLIELCLRIPVHVLCAGGRDRSIARSAFENAVPDEIVYRRAKGSAGEQVRAIVANNLPLIRELLLDGFLARSGMLDRAATDEALSGRPTRLRSFDFEVLHYLNIEAWALAWQSSRQQAAA